MSIHEIQKLVDDLHYWDARVAHLNCNYFADEIELCYKDGNTDVFYRFLGCYKSNFNHVKSYDKLKPVSKMEIAQLPYFLQDVEFGETSEMGITFYTCKINMFPMDLEIWCKDIKIIAKEHEVFDSELPKNN